MSRFIKRLKFEIRAMEINFYIPFIFILFVLLTNLVMLERGVAEGNIILTSEIFIPFGAAWLSIFAMKDLVEDEGSEVLFSFPIRRAMFSLIKVFKYLVIYLLGVFVYSIITTLLYGELNLISLFLQLSIECLFMSSLGYTLTILTKNSGLSIAVVGIYMVAVGLYSITISQSQIRIISIMLYNVYTMPIMDMLYLSMKTLVMGMGIYLLGYINFSNKLR
ncbi:MAG: hypothetical protein ACRC7N_20255 [Clostridium sp.]